MRNIQFYRSVLLEKQHMLEFIAVNLGVLGVRGIPEGKLWGCQAYLAPHDFPRALPRRYV